MRIKTSTIKHLQLTSYSLILISNIHNNKYFVINENKSKTQIHNRLLQHI